MFKRLLDNTKQFLSDVKAEVKKVSFPSREETIGSTLVVIVFCLVMSVYLSVVDSFLVWLVSRVI
jgi:preprotein translocase subunit SecE